MTLRDLSDKYRAAVTLRGIAGEIDPTALLGEQLTLLEGLVRAWHRVRLPAILAEYDVVSVEEEYEYELAPGIIVMVRFDAPLRRKRDGLLFIKDYKTLSAVYDNDWGKKFEHDSQLLCYTLAAEAIFKEPIGGLLMEGLLKGRRAIDKSTTSPFYGQVIQQSPFCYAYKAPVAKGWGAQFVYEKSWSRGAEKVPVWEMPGGIEHWLATEYSDLDLADFFLVLPAIRPDRRDMARWQRQMAAQESRIQLDVLEAEAERLDAKHTSAYEDTLDAHFPQNQAHCFRYFGHPCAMERLCFTEEIEADPLGSGLYQVRVPHHSTEETHAGA